MKSEKIKNNILETSDEETMTDDELLEWIGTSKRVLKVLAEENKETYDNIYKDFIKDVQAQVGLGRITEEEYDEILEDL
jgi:hypothetical protein